MKILVVVERDGEVLLEKVLNENNNPMRRIRNESKHLTLRYHNSNVFVSGLFAPSYVVYKFRRDEYNELCYSTFVYPTEFKVNKRCL